MSHSICYLSLKKEIKYLRNLAGKRVTCNVVYEDLLRIVHNKGKQTNPN